MINTKEEKDIISKKVKHYHNISTNFSWSIENNFVPLQYGEREIK